jgi:hypothetical protein
MGVEPDRCEISNKEPRAGLRRDLRFCRVLTAVAASAVVETVETVETKQAV